MDKPLMLITGGSQGIGAATALLAAQAGYNICFSYHSQASFAQQISTQLTELGAEVLYVQADVSIEADVLNLFDQIDTRFGRIDALINNAGILRKKLVVDIDVKELEKLFGVNVIGSFICAREAIKRMAVSRGGKGGVIVNVSSIASRVGSPFEYIDYAATKGAIDTFTLGLAKEVVAEGIRVNAVRPGIIQTEIHAKGGEPGRIERLKSVIPMQRAGTAEEVAKAILWLVSDDSSYTTGHLLDVGGGR
ncbi:short-chain dehydrogenase [Cellvibrio zantedeschiae]|uniref:Short-chain dehydrogenase n=1 Tax=Cellvibrio zantedeschiae TaxID=1237077 RepID=A0ABQ3B8S7_9GAMM|nr:SDR family oxidoreductase [Cellvibrio zantedeschiae]GGY84758.1 short-chain dehydrogenase [Cellvibrio zantedeschiae]